jgi:hypothetical protein
MAKWQEFLNTLNSPSGHVFILLFCSVGLLFGVWHGMPKTEALLGETYAVLLYSMRPQGKDPGK